MLPALATVLPVQTTVLPVQATVLPVQATVLPVLAQCIQSPEYCEFEAPIAVGRERPPSSIVS